MSASTSKNGHPTVAPGTVPTPKDYPFASAPEWPPAIGTPAAPQMPRHACMGLNACQGQDRYGAKGHPVEVPDRDNPGFVLRGYQPNDCAGQGYCANTADHTCHVKNDCANQGGCGLYGTAEELDQPGVNACKSLGSCATPINAERFSSNGPNKSYSVWKRARQVFEAQWPERRKELLATADADGADLPEGALPETLGDAPAPFTETGPPYLWVSDNSTERSNMTACGASGMSGAGGCA